MLNIGKLAAGGERYYLDTVASGVEDYYTGAGEAPGYWVGAAAPNLGLGGRVAAETLRAVLGAADPTTGDRLTTSKGQRAVPGFDCTFRSPKSVSLLYGLGDAETSVRVRDAHDAAVAAALSYLERHAGFSRRGHAGVERISTTGFVAAAFRHRTSRAGDPLLHTHVLISNLGQARDDGRWRTLDARSLYLHAKTAGYLYQAHLRDELTRRLGVEWGTVRNGCADLAGIPEAVLRAFSQRRAEIEAQLQRRGENSARAAQAATLATRKPKNRAVEPAALGAEWLTRSAALGFGPDQLAALVGRQLQQPLERTLAERVAGELAGPSGLTAHASTFTRRDVVRAWCDRLPAGAPVGQVLGLADALVANDAGAVIRLAHSRVLSGDQALRRADGAVVASDLDEPRYSTPELLALEQRAITVSLARGGAGTAVADQRRLDAAIARRPTLALEQAAMVRRLATSGAGVEVVVGKAGAGKTFALDAARDAWQASGTRVIGCALAARAAAELQAGAGIASTTIDALLIDLDRSGPGAGLASGSVLVVDEAGMVGTRKLVRLLDHAQRANAKVVLVGDHHQLPEVDAGGVFRGLVNRLPVIELSENRRQRQQWERDALDELRTGEPAAALTAYQREDRLIVGDTAEAVREQLVSDWWAARTAHDGHGDVGVMIAARVSDVDDLNDRARMRLAAAGVLAGPALETEADRAFQAGDRVVCLRNDRKLGVLNGSRAEVVAVDPDGGTLEARIEDSGRHVVVPAEYLDAGHVAHGYAITGHKAQGLTTGQAWVLGSDAMYREWGYVALSRGRDSNRLYAVAGAELDVDEHLHAVPAAQVDPLRGLAQSLRRTRGQHLAIDQAAVPEQHSNAEPQRDAGGVPTPLSLVPDDQGLDRQHQLVIHEVEAARRRLAQAEHQAHGQSAVGRLFNRPRAREAATEVARLAEVLSTWQHRLRELSDALDHRNRQETLAPRASSQPTPAAFNPVEIGSRIARPEIDPPAYLTAVLGPPPADPAARGHWRSAAKAVARYRDAWAIDDQVRPLGPRPAEPLQRQAYDVAADALRAARQQLPASSDRHRSRPTDLGLRAS